MTAQPNAPYIRAFHTTESVMRTVCLAAVPLIISAIWRFGIEAVWVLLTATVTCSVTDMVCRALRVGEFRLGDGSEIVTAILLALSLPSHMPLWAVALSGVFAIGVVKEWFGGIGRNLFNPAMAARAFLTVVFPATLRDYTLPDAVTTATPLEIGGDRLSMLFGQENGSIGETSALLILFGGAILLTSGVVKWRVPVCGFVGFILTVWVFGGDIPFTGAVIEQLLSGGFLFALFFMITDYTTKPVTPWGEGIYAALFGILTAILRLYGRYPEGACFAILTVNVLTPLIEYITTPRVYGTRKRYGERRMRS